MRDKHGKLIESENTVDFKGYKQYVRELMAEAGLIDPELEEAVDKLRKAEADWSKLERFFGAAGAIVEA